ncbi:hypothetical protein CO2235_U780015 [Cupriavidus oxalaticus]|uniref:Uncharacterized protein n=1 Tax=Cupriavidus oxalaticus TaxID=96344 RepID=A0A375FMB4_9BURK|nr:hypothetical protein CO2235_U780015 [Cupriavidus oxalaticus]
MAVAAAEHGPLVQESTSFYEVRPAEPRQRERHLHPQNRIAGGEFAAWLVFDFLRRLVILFKPWPAPQTRPTFRTA